MKIAIIGAIPPPYGGISVHIQRFKHYLEGKGHTVTVYELFRDGRSPGKNVIYIKNVRRWLLKYIFTAGEDVIHLHTEAWQLRAIMGLMSVLRKKTVITIHSESLHDSLETGGWLKHRLIKFGLRRTACVITVNPRIKDLALSIGVRPERVAVIPAFIPPVVRDEDLAAVPPATQDFIRSHSPLLSANAFKIVFYHNQDLYGIDMCIDLCAALKPNYPNVGLVFCLPEIGDLDYFGKMQARIAGLGIQDNFLFQTGPGLLYPVLMRSDVFLRPTNADGFGISVAEAIYFKVPAIASDVCARAPGTVLFKSRDAEDFTRKVQGVLADLPGSRRRIAEIKLENGADRIMAVYQELAGRGREGN